MSGPRNPTAAVSELLRRYALSDDLGGRLLALLALLAEDEQAPTTVTDPRAAVDVHLADSLVALDLPIVRGASSLVDIGAGAGFPGLALALALPRAEVVLLEANGRKAEFLDRAIAVTGAANVRVVNARAEEWRAAAGADLVTARALAALAVVAEYAAPLLGVGGSLVAWRGKRDPDGEAAAERAGLELGLGPGVAHPVVPYAGAEHRHLHVLRKFAETPSRFPRRPGVASKRPLGSSPARRAASERPAR